MKRAGSVAPVLREGGGGTGWPRRPPALGKGFEVRLSPRLCPPRAQNGEARGGKAVCECPERLL